ncbi:MAG TPA: MerR family transcriptional regulator [Gaiellaceae bacterium]|nr:MerR family transcriptional regulator [Gaiellaceae bacterium]
MAPNLNIAALARRTGVPADTIRKWEQRYGVLRPERTTGGQRRYSEEDVARVEWLKARLSEGYRIGEAATLLGSVPLATPASPDELREALAGAVVQNDLPSLIALVDQALALNQLEDALSDVLAPALAAVGESWEAGEISVAQEHLASGVVRAHLERLLADSRAAIRGTAVLACAPGERHELGLLMLAVLLRADGWQVAYLGADTPVGDAVALAEESGARLLCFSATMVESGDRVHDELAGRRLPEGLQVVVGGAGIEKEVARELGVRYLNGDLRRSVGAIRKLAP